MALDEKQKRLIEKLRGQASNFKKYQQKTVLSKLNDLEKEPTETTKATTDEAGTINPQFPTNAVMLIPPQAIETKIKMFQRAIDPQDLHSKGFELSPHVTVWSGGDSSLPAYHFMEQAEGQTPFYVNIEGMGVFERPEFDVLYIGVESSDLRELNARFNNLQKSERNIFTPHVTVAYLKPGLAQKYLVNLFPYTSQFRVSGLTFSNKDRQKMDMFFNRRQLSAFIPTTKAASIIVFTDKEGRDRWVSVSSTAFKDRDSEIVSSRSLKQAVAIGDATGKRGPLRFWHLPGVDLGDCDFQMIRGNMLIESGTFRKKEYAQAVAKIAPSLGVSLGFKHPITEPENGIFNNIFIYERSILPAHKAANPFTSITLKDTDMTTQAEKEEFFVRMVGKDLAGEFLQETAQKDQDLIDAGIAHKEFNDMTPDELRAFANDVQLLADEKEAEAQTAAPVGEFVTQKEFKQGLQMILAAIDSLNTASNATKETQAAIDGNLAKLKANQEQLQAELDGILGNASKSASHRPTRDNDAGIDVNALLSQAGVNSTKEWGIFSDAMQDLTGGA